MLTPSPSRRNTALRAYSALRALRAHQRVQPAPQPGLLADAAYREQRARDVGRGRVAGVVADGEAFVGGAENRLAGEDEGGQAERVDLHRGPLPDRGAAGFADPDELADRPGLRLAV